jgi:hypothetical protein
MLRVTAWPNVILSKAKNLSGDVAKMARLVLSSAKRPSLSKGREPGLSETKGCGVTSWRRSPGEGGMN